MARGWFGAFKCGMVRKGPAEKVTCEPSLGGGEEVDHAGSWGESIPGRGTSLSKGPEVGACLACLRKDTGRGKTI